MDQKKLITEFCQDLKLENIFLFSEQTSDEFRKYTHEHKTSGGKKIWLMNVIKSLYNNIDFYKSSINTLFFEPNNPWLNNLNKYIGPINIKLFPNTNEYIIPTTKLSLENKLNNVKTTIDNFINNNQFKEKLYSYITNKLTPFNNLKYKVFIDERGAPIKHMSVAWCKCWEIIHSHNLLDNYNPLYNVFCNAEFPGSFIFAISHYLKTKNLPFNWVANSLYEENMDKKGTLDALTDQWGLYKNYKSHWLMNKEMDGNILKKDVIEYIENKLSNSIDLYTSDIGIAMNEKTFNKQEYVEANLNLAQIICALKTLRSGGNAIFKMFLFFTPFNMSLLYVVSKLFKEFYITKPISSKPANSEFYIVAKGFNSNNKDPVINQLTDILYNWDETKLDNRMNTVITPIEKSFYAKLILCSYELYTRQIEFVKENVFVSKSYFEREAMSTTEKLYYRQYKEKYSFEKFINYCQRNNKPIYSIYNLRNEIKEKFYEEFVKNKIVFTRQAHTI